ncbi:MAG: hypothetical protein H9W81_15035 [Enterococcus sp.]|nr:hypothetical protein [Enterococcus sp.]
MELIKYEINEKVWSERLYFECICKYVLERFLNRYEDIVDESFTQESMRKFMKEKSELFVEEELQFKIQANYESSIDYIPEERQLDGIMAINGSHVEVWNDYCFESESNEYSHVEFAGDFEWGNELLDEVIRIIWKELNNFISNLHFEYRKCREGFNEAFEAFQAKSKKKSYKDLTVDMFVQEMKKNRIE